MSGKRFDNRVTKVNSHEMYKELFEKRNVPQGVSQYSTPVLKYPDANQIQSLTRLSHIWKYGDRYYKLAHEYYGDPKLWWVIAWYNKSPTEAHNSLGDTLYIPFPLEKIYNYFGL
jgi:nucleoid-associated protein YgaU